MTVTNHVMAGAIIAVAVQKPELAIPLAFISHFVLDALPHFGRVADNVFERNKNKLFRTVVSIDTVLSLSLLVLLPFLLHNKVDWWVTFVCILAAVCPDFVWVYRFFGEIKSRNYKKIGWFSRFHKWIQWGERPWGIILEFFIFGGMATVLINLT